MTLNILDLWNFNDPAESEKRFRSALETASPDEALILKTQMGPRCTLNDSEKAAHYTDLRKLRTNESIIRHGIIIREKLE